MDLNDIKDLLRALQQQDFEEFELEHEGWRLRIRKGGAAASVERTTESGREAEAFSAVGVPGRGAEGNDMPRDEGLVMVKSPMVGTFYRAANPEAPAFVDVGDRIREGQILCIIEAMKLMNEIEAEQAGEIVRVLVESGQAVQYGDPLFALRPA